MGASFKKNENIKHLRLSFTTYQGFMQKEKVDINGEKDAQINILAKKIVTQGWHQVMIIESKQASLPFTMFIIMTLLYYYSHFFLWH